MPGLTGKPGPKGELVLTPFDDYPVHQTALPIAHAGGGHPDFYDRFWLNAYTEDYYFAVALGIYPNRGVIDAAFGAVHDGWQRSVFASGRLPLDPTPNRVGPLRQSFFLWAPLNLASECLHFMTFEDAAGKPWAKTAAVLPVIPKAAPVFGPGTEAEPIEEARHQVHWAPGLRRSQGATLAFIRAGEPQPGPLAPLLTFRMRGAGY